VRKILFVTFQDFANVSTDISWAINTYLDGWEARVCSCTPHPFDYPRKHHIDFDFSTPDQKAAMESWIREGLDVLVWAEEGFPDYYYSFYAQGSTYLNAMLFGMREALWTKVRKFIFHAGVSYRTHFERYNALDAEWFDGQITSPDLWRLSRDLEGVACFGKPIIGVEESDPSAGWERLDSLTVCHSPTDYGHKGTRVIDAAVERVQKRLPQVQYRRIGGPVADGAHVPHEELARQRRACHVYIDQFSEIGGIGMSALEAMGDGLVTLCTTQMVPDSVWRASGLERSECPIVSLPAPTRDLEVDIQAVESALLDVCSRPDELPALAERGARWAREKMDPRLFAERFILSLKEPLC